MTRCRIVDYGRGNLFSVCRAVEHCGAVAELTSDPDEVRKADRLVLPGVGAFRDAMTELDRLGLVESLIEFSTTGRPFLGICLGMQIMFDHSEEFGSHPGLGLIPGRVTQIARALVNGRPCKIPHIGWSTVVAPDAKPDFAGTILDGLAETVSCYFVHSYTAHPDNEEHRVADCVYAGQRICAIVNRDMLWGCQFHPEKSGKAGLRIFRNFLAL